MNITNIAQYFGWAFLAVFVAIAFFVIIGLYLDSVKTKSANLEINGKPKKEEEQSKFKSIGTKRALRQDKKDKKVVSKESLAQNVFIKGKQATVAFAPQAGSASVDKISEGLLELNGANSSNPFRATVDEEDIFLQQKLASMQQSESIENDFEDTPAETEAVEPVETNKISAPTIAGPPSVVSSNSKSVEVVAEEDAEEVVKTTPQPFRRPLPPPPSGLK